jgi:cell division septation protein DedD
MANAGAGTGRSLSLRQLTLIFFLAVVVCAVFFALGFVFGSNQNTSREAQSVEQVAPRSEIPPTVNPSAQEAPPSSTGAAAASEAGSANVIEQDLKSAGNATPPAAASGQASERALSPAQVGPAPHEPEAGSVPTRPRAPRGIMVQVAASHTEGHARSLVRKLRARGYRAVLIAPRGSRIYRVQVGPYRSHEEAVEAARRLRREGFRPFIR